MNTDISIEPLLNQRVKGRLSGNSSNRQVALNSSGAVQITPTSGCVEMHIYNNLGVSVRYGGSGVTTTSGGILFNQATLALNPTNSFSFYMIPVSSSGNIDIVEFF